MLWSVCGGGCKIYIDILESRDINLGRGWETPSDRGAIFPQTGVKNSHRQNILGSILWITREVIEDILCEAFFVGLCLCACWVWSNVLLLYKQKYTDISEQNINRKWYCHKVIPRNYKRTYIVVQLCAKFCRMVFPGTYKLYSDPEGLIYIQKY